MNHTLHSWNCTVAVALGVTAAGIAQDPFQVDQSFQTQLLSTSTVGDVVELPDGKLFVSGSLRYPGDPQELSATYRLLPNGQKDNSLPWAPGGGPIRQWNDQWYVGGGQGVVRLLADGTWDQSFFPGFINGTNPSALFSIGQGGDFAVRSNGGLLLAGDHPLNDTARDFVGFYQLVWVDSSGELDTTMIHRQANGTLWSIQELPDGKYITGAGGVTMFDGQPVGGIIRTHPDGAVDTDFMSPQFTWGIPYVYLPLPDGKVIVGGFMQLDGGDTLSLFRLMPDGTLDPTFNNGLQTIQQSDPNNPNAAPVRGILPYGPDRYIITGYFSHVAGEEHGGVALVDTAGFLVDEPWIGTGSSPVAAFGPAIGLEGAIRLQNGKHMIFGTYQGYTDGLAAHPMQRGVTRLHSDPVGIREQDAPNFSLYPNPASTHTTVEFEVMPRNGHLTLRDALGREVQRQRISGYHNTLALQGLGAGVYLLELWEDGIRNSARRLVVER